MPLLYGHVYVLPVLGDENLENSDHNAEMLKVILLAKPNGGTLQSVQAGASVRFCVCAGLLGWRRQVYLSSMITSHIDLLGNQLVIVASSCLDCTYVCC